MFLVIYNLMFTLTSRGCRRCVVWLGNPSSTTYAVVQGCMHHLCRHMAVMVVEQEHDGSSRAAMRQEDLYKPFIKNLPVAVARL